jgi:hypothetical protein
MKNFLTKPAVFIQIAIMLSGCASQRITTTWKTEYISPPEHQRILVVTILPDQDTSDRKVIEQNFTAILNGLGYQAVSAVSEYGLKGLANLGEENTYTKLHNSGIDAVLIVALVNTLKERNQRPANVYTYPNAYYYRRIWNYKNTLVQPGADTSKHDRYSWESLLFDLSKLEVDCAVRTPSSSKAEQLKMNDDMARKIIQKMVKEKTLKQKAGMKGF